MSMVVSDPDLLGGVLVFQATRVPIRNLFDYLLAGESIKGFLEDFPTVSFEQVRYVLHSAEVAFEKNAA